MVNYKANETVRDIWPAYKASCLDGGTKDLNLRNQLIEIYLPLVEHNAERVHAKLPGNVDINDLISAGAFGLMDAIDTFDLGRGYKFESYCVPRIRGAMLDELRTMDWVPRLVRSNTSKLKVATTAVQGRLGRPGNDHEIAREMNLSSDDYDSLKKKNELVNVQSIYSAVGDTHRGETTFLDLETNLNSEDPTEKLKNMDLLRLVTRGLNQNERLLMIGYYCENQTMQEIGDSLGLSESRVSQIHASIIEQLGLKLAGRRDEFVSDQSFAA
jgi:RNA polymerase sigma factor FliA